MKYLFSGLVLMLFMTMVGCDQSSPTGRSEQSNPYSEESMLRFASTKDGDPELLNPAAGMHNGPRHGQMLQHLATYLGLTAEQQEAVEQLGGTMFAELSAIRDQVQSGDLTPEEAQPLVQDLRTKFMDDVRALLTGEQQALLDEWQSRQWQHQGGPRGHRGPHGHHQFGG